MKNLVKFNEAKIRLGDPNWHVSKNELLFKRDIIDWLDSIFKGTEFEYDISRFLKMDDYNQIEIFKVTNRGEGVPYTVEEAENIIMDLVDGTSDFSFSIVGDINSAQWGRSLRRFNPHTLSKMFAESYQFQFLVFDFLYDPEAVELLRSYSAEIECSNPECDNILSTAGETCTVCGEPN